MKLTLSYDDFTKIPYSTGTIQNISEKSTVEVSTTPEANTGVVLYAGDRFDWSNSTIYARAKWGVEDAVIAAIPVVNSSGGSVEFATTEEIEKLIADVYMGGGSDTEPGNIVATDVDIQDLLDEVYG